MPSKPEYYDLDKFSEEPLKHREAVEAELTTMYTVLNELRGIERIKMQKRVDHMEAQLAFQGANPKQIPIEDLAEHIRDVPDVGSIEAKYRNRINNRTTGIRAYCIMCMGDDTVAVRECAMVTCPLHPFRMGKDPFRGYDLPKVETPIEPDEYEDTDLEDDDD